MSCVPVFTLIKLHRLYKAAYLSVLKPVPKPLLISCHQTSDE